MIEMATEIETFKLEKKANEPLLQEKIHLENSYKLLNERYDISQVSKKQLTEENADSKKNFKLLESKNKVNIKEIDDLKQKLEIIENEFRKKELERFSEAIFIKKNEVENENNDENKILLKLQQENYDKEIQIKDLVKKLEKSTNSNNDLKEDLYKIKEKSLQIQEKFLLISTMTQTFESKTQDLSRKNEDKKQENFLYKRKIIDLEEEIKNIKQDNKTFNQKNSYFEFKEKNLILQEKILLLSALNQNLIETVQQKETKIDKISKEFEKSKEQLLSNIKSEILEKTYQIKTLENEMSNLKNKSIDINTQTYLELKEKYLFLQERMLIICALNQTLIEQKKEKIFENQTKKKKIQIIERQFSNKEIQTLEKILTVEPTKISLKSLEVQTIELHFLNKEIQTLEIFFPLDEEKKVNRASLETQTLELNFFNKEIQTFEKLLPIDQKKNIFLGLEDLWNEFNEAKEFREKLNILHQVIFFIFIKKINIINLLNQIL